MFRLFLKKGYAPVSFSDLVEATNVSRGNWRVFNWVRTALMTKMAYLFYEDDGGAKVTVSAFGKEVEATVSLGDLVGSSWVYFLDPLNKSYKISNSFEFTIDQQM